MHPCYSNLQNAGEPDSGPIGACLLGHPDEVVLVGWWRKNIVSLIGAGPGQELHPGGPVQMADHRPVLPGGQLR